jgi:hypothetical protein
MSGSAMNVVVLVVEASLLGLIPMAIIRRKGRDGHGQFVWWAFGALLFIVALPAALLAKPLRSEAPPVPVQRPGEPGAGPPDA